MHFLFIILLVALTAVSGESTPSDPLEWTRPTQVPEVRQVVPSLEYSQRMQAASAEISRRKTAQTALPEKCLEITVVRPDAPASKLGIRSGHFILNIDGTPTFEAAKFNDLRSKTKGQTLTLWGADRGKYEVQIQPGVLGITFIDFVPGLVNLELESLPSRLCRSRLAQRWPLLWPPLTFLMNLKPATTI